MIHLNIGSNLNSSHGSRFDNISIAVQLLIKVNLKIEKVSNFYETPSYPNKNLPKFLNIGILASYNYNFLKLLNVINLIQKKIGRIKAKKNDPRIIDIDIVDFNGLIKDSENIILPHPRAHLRNFVFFPIFQFDPIWSHPILRKNAQFLIKNLSQKSRIEITRLYKSVKINT